MLILRVDLFLFGRVLSYREVNRESQKLFPFVKMLENMKV